MRELGLTKTIKLPHTILSAIIFLLVTALIGGGWTWMVLDSLSAVEFRPGWLRGVVVLPVWAVAGLLGHRIAQWYLYAITGIVAFQLIKSILAAAPELADKLAAAAATDTAFDQAINRDADK